MAEDVLKFRCYQCGKLLGASPRKAGRPTTCPNCKAELLVPEPTAEPDLEDAIRSLTPRIDEIVKVAEPKPASPVHEPGFTWEEIDTAIFKSAAEATILTQPEMEIPRLDLPPPAPEPDLLSTPIQIQPVAIEVDLAMPPLLSSAAKMPEIAVEPPPMRGDRPATRRRSGDVVLSQTVLASWSLFVVLALAISFVAGLFVGHFVWKQN